MGVKVAEIGGDGEVGGGEEFAGRLAGRGGFEPARIGVELDRVAKHPAHRFEDATLEVFIVFFREHLVERGDAHGDADHLLGVAEKI